MTDPDDEADIQATHELNQLRLKRDILVRTLRTCKDYKQRLKLNEMLDHTIDKLETMEPCDYCMNTIKDCTCPF